MKAKKIVDLCATLCPEGQAQFKCCTWNRNGMELTLTSLWLSLQKKTYRMLCCSLKLPLLTMHVFDKWLKRKHWILMILLIPKGVTFHLPESLSLPWGDSCTHLACIVNVSVSVRLGCCTFPLTHDCTAGLTKRSLFFRSLTLMLKQKWVNKLKIIMCFL